MVVLWLLYGWGLVVTFDFCFLPLLYLQQPAQSSSLLLPEQFLQAAFYRVLFVVVFKFFINVVFMYIGIFFLSQTRHSFLPILSAPVVQVLFWSCLDTVFGIKLFVHCSCVFLCIVSRHDHVFLYRSWFYGADTSGGLDIGDVVAYYYVRVNAINSFIADMSAVPTRCIPLRYSAKAISKSLSSNRSVAQVNRSHNKIVDNVEHTIRDLCDASEAECVFFVFRRWKAQIVVVLHSITVVTLHFELFSSAA